MRSRGLALAAAATLTLVLAPVALGDGDPASDVLVSQAAFVPSDTGATNRQDAQLLSVLQAAQRAGFPVRVAIIPDSYDLGSVTALGGGREITLGSWGSSSPTSTGSACSS